MKTCKLKPANVLPTEVLIQELLSRGEIGAFIFVERGRRRGDPDLVTTRFKIPPMNPYPIVDGLVREFYHSATKAFGPRTSPPEGFTLRDLEVDYEDPSDDDPQLS